jgi:hypothetical protein
MRLTVRYYSFAQPSSTFPAAVLDSKFADANESEVPNPSEGGNLNRWMACLTNSEAVVLAFRSTVLNVASVCKFLPANTRMMLRSGTPGPCPSVLNMSEPGRWWGVNGGGPRAVLVELLDIDTLTDEAPDAREELVFVVVVLTLERLDDPGTEGFIAGEPGLAPAAAVPEAATAWNAELDINADADWSP